MTKMLRSVLFYSKLPVSGT